MTDDELSTKEMRQKADHQEILGETLAKFEFFQHRWHPYSRFLDIDKVDLVLRRRVPNGVIYREVQVKFGKLYTCSRRWEKPLFSHTSWRFFSEKNLDDLIRHKELFLSYILSPDDGFKGDRFIFPVVEFSNIIKQSDSGRERQLSRLHIPDIGSRNSLVREASSEISHPYQRYRDRCDRLLSQF